MDLVKLLKRCEVFIGLDDSDLEEIADLPSWRISTYNAGDFIFHEAATAKDFHILEEGEISLLITSRQTGTKKLVQVPVDTVTKGDVFGWSSLVAPHTLTMSAICVKPSYVLAVCGAELNKMMDLDHYLGYEVMKGLVRVIGARLRDLRGKLVGKEKLPLPESKACPE